MRQLHGHMISTWPLAATGRLIAALSLLTMLVILSACNSGSLTEGLQSAAGPQPSQSVGNQPGNVSGGTATLDGAATNPAGQAGQQTAALPAGNSVTFLPVSNAPQTAVTNLARSIRSEAQKQGVPVVASVQQGAAYQVKGYFSALEDGSGTLLVYVWDILDRNNKRVYRINGQEQAGGRSSDPWAAVTPQMLDRVAQSTMAQLKSWLSTR
ncbi:hypothetical protein [Salaquimonas pukyongi]|uniref:hypothetical protein n=1 Tax=Salaquimonas pukyongi TaxID=2712698 RepID=UPI0012EC7022|nr:hypothetical protein [Salaquimonas pukyongi]